MTAGQRGGRPRDPEVAPKVLAAARALLAEGGMAAFTGDALAARARVGKASIYRRWDSLVEVLVDVVRQLGVRDVDHGEGPGSAREDLTRLLHAATSGPDAVAEVAALSSLPYSTQLQVAYQCGPRSRLVNEIMFISARATDRGDHAWPSYWPVLAGVQLLHAQAAAMGEQPNLLDALGVVDTVVLPALGYAPAVDA